MASKALLAQIRTKKKSEDIESQYSYIVPAVIRPEIKKPTFTELSLFGICFEYLAKNIQKINCENLIPELKIQLLECI